MMQSEYLKTAVQAAKKAEEVILRYYKSDIAVSKKSDQSPVTIADKKAEEIIVATLKKQFPTHGFFGEEGARDLQEYTWIIDPLDGTKNFIKQIPIFGTLIALMKNDKIILGVSNMPALQEMGYAELGAGGFINEKRVHVSTISKIADATTTYSNMRYFPTIEKQENLCLLINDSYFDRGYGDVWMYHFLAQGKTDIVVEAKARIWDVAPLKILLEEAGGKMTDILGNKLTLDATTVLATNGVLHKKALGYFS